MSTRRGNWSEVEILVSFHEVDAMQVVWHGHYLKYFEIARSALFDKAGIDLYTYHAESGHLFPIVKTETRHGRPLRYRDRIICGARLVEARRRIIVEFEIRRAADGVVCATGRSVQVAIRGSDFGLELAIPQQIQDALNKTL